MESDLQLCQSKRSYLETLLAGIENNVVLVKNSNGQIYWPELTINDIGKWKVVDGYQFYMDNPDTLAVTGSQLNPSQMPVQLFAGYNLVSYLPMTAAPIEQELASISSSLVLVKNGAGKLYWPEFGINQIGDMQPGEGYSMYLSSPATLTYPGS